MFNKLLNKLSIKKNNEEIFAHASGELIKIENVPDPIFSEKMMGEGIAILPSRGEIVAPADGEIIMIAETKHAFALRTALGEELLVHIGLETVELKGQGFNVLVKLGDKVVKGQLVVEADLEFIKKNASSTIIPMVVTNNAQGCFHFEWENIKEVKAGETKVFTTSIK
jgi:sugar PTS system EIIA component